MHLDGAQTFGALDVNLAEIAPDSYSTSAHKWLMGPLEAGLLYVKAERIPQVWPSIVTAGWADNLKGARKLEVFGQRRRAHREEKAIVGTDAQAAREPVVFRQRPTLRPIEHQRGERVVRKDADRGCHVHAAVDQPKRREEHREVQ